MNAAKGRLDHGPPVAVIDIGSNSVRLVIYEGLTRSPTPIFNEKVLAGLGRQVQTTGLLAPAAIDTALETLKRFRALCDTLHVRKIWAIATAACFCIYVEQLPVGNHLRAADVEGLPPGFCMFQAALQIIEDIADGNGLHRVLNPTRG